MKTKQETISCSYCAGMSKKEKEKHECYQLKPIDYYGSKDNYIHLKWGDIRKMYNFTKEFIAEYPDFAREYKNYFMGKKSKFDHAFRIASYINENNIPVHFYFNFTDEPAKNHEEVLNYLIRENTSVKYLKLSDNQ